MWRDIDDPRALEHDRPEPSRGRVDAQTEIDTGTSSNDPRDVFTRDLDLPRGPAREVVHANDKQYRLSGEDVRVMATVGAFRVVPSSDLRASTDHTPVRPARDLERLQDLGLVRTTPYVVGSSRTRLVMLTSEGRSLLEQSRTPDAHGPRQAFHVGINKPRELAHDARVYAAYMRAAERHIDGGGRIRRVILEEDLKRDYQRFLHAEKHTRKSRGESPERHEDLAARWARDNELPYEDGRVQLPDARLECEDRDGRRVYEDIEVVTPHYRGAHAAAKARSGFTRYRSVGARLGGTCSAGRSGRSIDPRLAEELLP